MKQCVLDVNLIPITICHLNSTPTDALFTILLITVALNRHKINHYTKPNLQLSVLTNKPDQMVELLEATRKMMKYFKRSLKHNPSHPNNTSNLQRKTSTSHSDKHKCNSYYHKVEVTEITPDNYAPSHIAMETNNIPDNSDVHHSDSTTDAVSDCE